MLRDVRHARTLTVLDYPSGPDDKNDYRDDEYRTDGNNYPQEVIRYDLDLLLGCWRHLKDYLRCWCRWGLFDDYRRYRFRWWYRFGGGGEETGGPETRTGGINS
ncbi:unnamed protein product, partial [marine sediment metagenome]